MANVTGCSNPCCKRLSSCSVWAHSVFLSSSVLSDRSCLRVTAAPTSLDLDANVQRTLDNNLATEAYERRIKRLEQEKLELSRKLQGKSILKKTFFLFWAGLTVLGTAHYTVSGCFILKKVFLLSRKKLSCRNLCRIQYNIYVKAQN